MVAHMRFYWDQDMQSSNKHFAGGSDLHRRPKGQARRADALQQAADRSAQRPYQVTKKEQTVKTLAFFAEHQVLSTTGALDEIISDTFFLLEDPRPHYTQ